MEEEKRGLQHEPDELRGFAGLLIRFTYKQVSIPGQVG
jgi:hypothetical protein